MESEYSVVNRVFNGLAGHYSCSDTSIFPLFYRDYNRLSSNPSTGTVFMLTFNEILFIVLCLEWFLYGKISVPWALTCTVTLAKEVQLFPGPGIYSGIFAIYLQCPKKESRSAMIVFYVLCLLYVLSTATVVCDLLLSILGIYFDVSNNSIRNLKNMFFISYAGCTITSAWN